MKPKAYVTRLIPEKGLEMILDFCDAEVWEGEMPPHPVNPEAFGRM